MKTVSLLNVEIYRIDMSIVESRTKILKGLMQEGVASTLSSNFTKPQWDSIIETTYAYYPRSPMFHNDVIKVVSNFEVDGKKVSYDFFFQLGVSDRVLDTGYNLLGVDSSACFLVGVTPTYFKRIVEEFVKEVKAQVHTTNVYFSGNEINPSYCIQEVSRDVLIASEDVTMDSYLSSLPSKQRCKVRNSLKAIKNYGLKLELESLYGFSTLSASHIAWITSNTFSNFFDQIADTDGAMDILIQWYQLINMPNVVRYRVVDEENKSVAMLAFTQIPSPDDTLHYSFHSYVQDRNYKNIGSGLLLECIMDFSNRILTCSPNDGLMVHLQTAKLPGEEADPYVQYKKNISNIVNPVYSFLASDPNEDLPESYTKVYNSKTQEWV